MKSFRTEHETPVVQKDIIELEKKIHAYKFGLVDEDKFRSLRLARGIYGQRQPGVQMIRIKLPYGKTSAKQLNRIADVSDTYSTGNLHITTRQDIQIHYVSLDKTPELWEELEKDNVTIREACGNTVRNVTSSELAGVDPNEPFDVSPISQAIFEYFLRNPICQEMGRKFKISVSSSEKDTALAYMHDIGLIPILKNDQKHYKVFVGGGLGSQVRLADEVPYLIPENEIIPFIEATIRVFDRHGERKNRMKARLKFLVKDFGWDKFLELVEAEKQVLPNKTVEIPRDANNYQPKKPSTEVPNVELDFLKYNQWLKQNVFEQKQKDFYTIGVKVRLGNFNTKQARKLAELIDKYAESEIRFTLRQNFIIRSVHEDFLPIFFSELSQIGFAELGYNSLSDITACPGTDTCNLGIANSTDLANALEQVIINDYQDLVEKHDLKIKISGCMNSCGQHMMAHIGFQGMSLKTKDKKVAPAVQILLGGENKGNGQASFADKVIKIPSKRATIALQYILNDFKDNAGSLNFSEYYEKQGKIYFYDLLKPLADASTITENELLDWGKTEHYKKEIGVGECAGVQVDLIATLLQESDEKIALAEEALNQNLFADSIYHSYTVFINSAKAILTKDDFKTNSYASIINNFEEEYINSNKIELPFSTPFSELVNQIQKAEPKKEFAIQYLEYARTFHNTIKN